MSRENRTRAMTVGVVVVAWVAILGAVLLIGWLLTHPLESTVDPWDDDVARWFARRADRRPGPGRGRRHLAR